MIVFDLDGTLADCEHRRHFITKPDNVDFIFEDSIPNGNGCILTGSYYEKESKKKWQPDWDAFYEACDQDTLIYPVAMIFWSFMRNSYNEHVKIWSGRSESVREKTIKWIIDTIGIQATGNFEQKKDHFNSILKMRPIGDYTPDDQLKEKWLDEAIAQGKTIEAVFDDSETCCNMWNSRGIMCFLIKGSHGNTKNNGVAFQRIY